MVATSFVVSPAAVFVRVVLFGFVVGLLVFWRLLQNLGRGDSTADFPDGFCRCV